MAGGNVHDVVMIEENTQSGIMEKGEHPASPSLKSTNIMVDIGQSNGKGKVWPALYDPWVTAPERWMMKKGIVGAIWAAPEVAGEALLSNLSGMHEARFTNGALPHGKSCFNPLLTNQEVDSMEPIIGKNIQEINDVINSSKLNSSLIKDIIDGKGTHRQKHRGRVTIHGKGIYTEHKL